MILYAPVPLQINNPVCATLLLSFEFQHSGVAVLIIVPQNNGGLCLEEWPSLKESSMLYVFYS